MLLIAEMKILSLQHSFCLICIFSKPTTVQFACSQVVVYFCITQNPSQKTIVSSQIPPPPPGMVDFGCIFCWSKRHRFLSESSCRCLDEPWAMRAPGGLCWGGRLGSATGACKWWKSQGFQGPVKMSERM